VRRVQISPRYDGEPVVQVSSSIEAGAPLVRQRDRLAGLLGELTDDEWARPSRCAGWTVQDVVTHLITVNQFWTLSITSGLDAAPTRYLDGFDPVATPAQLVDGARGASPADTLARFVASNQALADTVSPLDEAGWSALAEAPPGLLSVRAVVLHGLWDAWIHERDIALPLGRTVAREPDEIIGSLAYVAALGPGFMALGGAQRTGVLELRVTDPDAWLVIEVGPSIRVHPGPTETEGAVLTGDAVAWLEALSLRGPRPSELAAQDRWLLGDLATVFDQSE
jgi:uncharacterized protein (TIGR03083 family)